MTQHTQQERDLVALLDRAAASVPDDVAAKLIHSLFAAAKPPRTAGPGTDAPTGSGRHSWVTTAGLVAAVMAIAAVPAWLIATRPDTGAPPPPATSDAARVDVEGPVTLTGTDLDGAPISTADYRGAPLLLTFWGSWCLPCRTQATVAADLTTDTDVHVLGVAVESGKSEARAASKELDLPYASLYDEHGTTYAQTNNGANPGGYPETILLDSDGTVAGRWSGLLDDEALAAVRAEIETLTATDDRRSTNGLSDAELVEQSWQTSIHGYTQRLIHLASNQQVFTSCEYDYAGRSLIIYGTGDGPTGDLLQAFAEHPSIVTPRWVTAPLNESDLARESRLVSAAVPQAWSLSNGPLAFTLIIDPSYRDQRDDLLAAARDVTDLPIHIRFEANLLSVG